MLPTISSLVTPAPSNALQPLPP
jgi:hypothetical protein